MRPRSDLYEYMQALADARREKGDAESRAMHDAMEWYQTRDAYAEALGILTSEESWWEASDAEKDAQIFARISMVMGRRVTPNLP